MHIWLRPQTTRNTGAPCSHRASVEGKRAGSQRAMTGIWTGDCLSAHPLIRATASTPTQGPGPRPCVSMSLVGCQEIVVRWSKPSLRGPIIATSILSLDTDVSYLP